MAPSPAWAMGIAATEQYELRDSPTNPSELARTLCPVDASNDPPSELVSRGSESRAARSARRAYSMRPSAGSEYTSSKQSWRSPGIEPSCAGSGSPAQGSSDVTLANPSAPWTRRSIPSRVKSLEYVLAARLPRNTRRPKPRDPASFSVSTWPRRTTVENSVPSRAMASAALAPDFIARATTSVAMSRRSVVSVAFTVWVLAAMDSYLAVPPTVMRSSLRVGMPTPTGTDCPSLPQVPIPSSTCEALPTIDTCVSAIGPLPISEQFLSG